MVNDAYPPKGEVEDKASAANEEIAQKEEESEEAHEDRNCKETID